MASSTAATDRTTSELKEESAGLLLLATSGIDVKAQGLVEYILAKGVENAEAPSIELSERNRIDAAETTGDGASTLAVVSQTVYTRRRLQAHACSTEEPIRLRSGVPKSSCVVFAI